MNITYCSECAEPYARPDQWPRVCIHCDATRWLNPTPVAAVVQPVYGILGALGIVMAKRAIEPAMGKWALVGGHMEVKESVEEAAMREFREETGLETMATPKIVSNQPVGPQGNQLLFITYVDKVMPFEVFERGKPCPENEELGILLASSDIELAFPTHREAARKFFAGEYE